MSSKEGSVEGGDVGGKRVNSCVGGGRWREGSVEGGVGGLGDELPHSPLQLCGILMELRGTVGPSQERTSFDVHKGGVAFAGCLCGRVFTQRSKVRLCGKGCVFDECRVFEERADGGAQAPQAELQPTYNLREMGSV